MVSCSRGKREQGEKAVAVEASSREGRLIDFQIFSRYISPVLSINKRYLQRISLCCVITGPRITSGSRYYILTYFFILGCKNTASNSNFLVELKSVGFNPLGGYSGRNKVRLACFVNFCTLFDINILLHLSKR